MWDTSWITKRSRAGWKDRENKKREWQGCQKEDWWREKGWQRSADRRITRLNRGESTKVGFILFGVLLILAINRYKRYREKHNKHENTLPKSEE